MEFLMNLNDFSENTQLDIIRTTSNQKVTTFFSKSSDPRKRAAVATNHTTLKHVLDEMVFDSCREVLCKLVENPSIKGVSLDRLLDITNDLELISSIARHPNTWKRTLEKITKGDYNVKPKVIAEERLSRMKNT